MWGGPYLDLYRLALTNFFLCNRLLIALTCLYRMGGNMSELTIMQTAAKLKMPVSVLAAWRASGELDGIDHPTVLKKSGRNIKYLADEIDAVAEQLPKDDYYPVRKANPEFWNRTLILKHGVSALLSCAILGPVSLRMRGNRFYVIEATSKIKDGAESARESLGKTSKSLDEIKRIESKHDFPGVQFTIKRVE